MAIQGSCLCGTLRYEIDGPFTVMIHCHCSMCRKHHGAPFVTFGAAPLEGFRWSSGESAVVEYASSPNGKRAFCRTCGSVAPVAMAGMIIVPAGALEGDPGIRPQAHMFVASKAPWYSISDSLPQHEAYPPEFGDATPLERPSFTAPAGKTLGSCLCGDVAYELTGAPVAMYQCHCSRCRRARGAAHGANMFYKLEQLRWIRGDEQVVDYKLPEAQRFGVAFCKRCGGAVPRVYETQPTVVVAAGALNTDPGMRPMAHICVASKAPWFEITDQIPQMQGLPSPPPAPAR
jgi:hypothetical protein